MAVKNPGFNDNVGARNRRVNRFGVAGGNRASRRHKVISDTTIGFNAVPTPDEITDSGNRLGQYDVDENVAVEGSTSNDGRDKTVQTVAAGALGIDQALVTEAAGAQIDLRSQNNLAVNRFS